MKKKRPAIISVVYEAATCEACGAPSHYGELVAVRVDIVSPTTLTISKKYAFICPSCYKKALKEA